jgi:hypothetical protein
MKWYRESFGAEMTELLRGNVLDYRSYLRNMKNLKATSVNTDISALISLDAFLTGTGRQKENVVSQKICCEHRRPTQVRGN